jgi:ABC-2 type transport system permease protein
MAVYQRSYQRYTGPMLGLSTRLLALARFTHEDMRKSRILGPVLYIGLIWPLVSVLLVYLHHNLDALRLMDVGVNQLLSIDKRFFYLYLSFQSTISFFVAALAGPGLISPDLANGALSTILARPIRRTDYVLGRMLPLAIMLSAITWIPGLFVFFFQTSMVGWDWFTANWRIAFGLFAGGLLWVAILSLMAIALSAWVKWKPVAGALMFAVFFISAAIGEILNALLETRWGHLINMRTLMSTAWAWLIEGEATGGTGFGLFYLYANQEIPVTAAFAMLALFCVLCIRLIAIRIRGAEVVR